MLKIRYAQIGDFIMKNKFTKLIALVFALLSSMLLFTACSEETPPPPIAEVDKPELSSEELIGTWGYEGERNRMVEQDDGSYANVSDSGKFVFEFFDDETYALLHDDDASNSTITYGTYEYDEQEKELKLFSDEGTAVPAISYNPEREDETGILMPHFEGYFHKVDTDEFFAPEEVIDQPFETVLLAETASLSYAPDIIFEASDNVENLGGWIDGNIVSWNFSVPNDDTYYISAEYSRPGNYEWMHGQFDFYQDNTHIDSMWVGFDPTTEPSPDGIDDWSLYTSLSPFPMKLPKGNITLELRPYFGTDGENQGNNFINLRSITVYSIDQSIPETEPETE